MRRSIRNFNIPPGQPPPGIWTFEGWIVQIPSPRGKKAVQMPHQLALKYLSSKTNFVFNQTLFTLFTERCAVITVSNVFWTPFWKSYSLTRAKFYLANPSNLAKTEKNSREYYARTRDKSGSNSPPFEGNVQIPPFPGTMHSQMPGVCPGGCWSFELIGALRSSGWLLRQNVTFADNTASYAGYCLTDISNQPSSSMCVSLVKGSGMYTMDCSQLRICITKHASGSLYTPLV